jgi:hypothetical protein
MESRDRCHPTPNEVDEMMNNCPQEFLDKHGLPSWETQCIPRARKILDGMRVDSRRWPLLVSAWNEYYEPTMFNSILCSCTDEHATLGSRSVRCPYLMMIGKVKETLKNLYRFTDVKYFTLYVQCIPPGPSDMVERTAFHATKLLWKNMYELTDNYMNMNQVKQKWCPDNDKMILGISINKQEQVLTIAEKINKRKEAERIFAEAEIRKEAERIFAEADGCEDILETVEDIDLPEVPSPAPVPSVIHAELVDSVRNGGGSTAQRTSVLEKKVEDLEQKVKTLESLIRDVIGGN